jgi:hypothetical protein
MKRILVVTGMGLLSLLNTAWAEPRRGDDCDRRSQVRSYRYDDSRYYNNSRYRYDDSRYRYNRRRDDDRSTAASVGIVAGSAAGGAAIGGLAGGGKGAVIGAIAGGAAGLVYDQATRDKDNDRRRRRW